MSEKQTGGGEQGGKERRSIRARLAGREQRLRTSAEGLARLFASLGNNEAGDLVGLWRRWPEIMGEDIAALGAPLGHAEHILQIGADDSMALQELSLQAEEIRERANAFLGNDWFTGVKVLLMQGRKDLAAPRPDPAPAPAPRQEAAEPPPQLGRLLGRLDPDSPITRCYEAFVALSQKNNPPK